MKTILLTGFEPFGGSHINPSIEACKPLDGKVFNGFKVNVVEIPLRFHEIRTSLVKAFEETKPSAVISTGQAGSSMIRLERVAINVADARIAYNCGKQPVDEPIVEDGPVAYFSTLPLRKMLVAIEEEKIPASISNSAGTFGCNHIFYDLMHHTEEKELGIPVGFIHVPSLPEQVMKKQGPSMSLDLITKALETAVEVTAEEL
jgi:pyroglutamyl-peptidase